MRLKVLGCLINLLKGMKTPPPYDYGDALMKLGAACKKSKAYSVILPGLYYDVGKEMYVIHFECAQKEYTIGKKKKYFLSVRRDEKLMSKSLEDLLDYAITYANFEDAFIRSPQDNLPEGVTMNIKNIKRIPGGNHLPTLPKWKL